MTSYVKFPRWLAWGFGAMIIFVVLSSQVSSWFNLDWSYMRWVALLGDFISFGTGVVLSLYYDGKESKKVKQ